MPLTTEAAETNANALSGMDPGERVVMRSSRLLPAGYNAVAEHPVNSVLFFSACPGMRTRSAPYEPPLK